MAANAYTTKLQAVNTILSVVGQAPRNSLTGSQTSEDRLALSILDEVIREVCIRGWHFNTEEDVPLVPDNDGFITVPGNWGRVDLDVSRYPTKNVVIKDGRLYDKDGRTFVWGSTVNATLVYLLDFEELPELARQYTMIRAARKFQERAQGSVQHAQFTARDEAQAYANLRHGEAQDSDRTIFDNWGVARVVFRGYPGVNW